MGANERGMLQDVGRESYSPFASGSDSGGGRLAVASPRLTPLVSVKDHPSMSARGECQLCEARTNSLEMQVKPGKIGFNILVCEGCARGCRAFWRAFYGWPVLGGEK